MAQIAATSPTTYQECYKPVRSYLPPIRYRKTPSFVYTDAKFQTPRKFPIKPLGPHGCRHADPGGPVLGLGTKNINIEKYLDPKPILCTLPPQMIKNRPPKSAGKTESQDGRRSHGSRTSHRIYDTKFGKMDSNMIHSLAETLRWTSTTKRESEDIALDVPVVKAPESTLEVKADPIRLGGQRYECEANEFQRAVLWDFVQPRGNVKIDDLNEKTHGRPEKLLHRRRKMSEPEKQFNGKSRELLGSNKLASIYVRQCPGYSGFVPREPPESEMERRQENPHMVSTMRATYKQLPVDEYKKQEFAKKGPLSRTVTLTYPFNPYNKVVKKHH